MYRYWRSLLALSLCCAALVLEVGAVASPSLHVLVAGAAGAVCALGQRGWAAALAIGLVLTLLLPGLRTEPGAWAIPLALAAAAVLPGRVQALRMPRWLLAAAPLAIALALTLSASGPGGWASLLAGLVGAVAGFAGAFAVGSAALGGQGPGARSGQSEDPRLVTRRLLLGRIAPDLSRELAQSLNVIVMANGNLAYVIDQLDLPDDERAQLTGRIARIGAHSDLSARILNLLRHFGEDEGRDGPMTVGSALERAIAAVQFQARSLGLSIELSGDALDFPARSRQGTIEMMGVAALLDMMATFGSGDGPPASGAILLDASHDGTEVVVSMQAEHLDPASPARDTRPVSGAAAEFAREFGAVLKQVSGSGNPAQMTIRLDRGAI